MLAEEMVADETVHGPQTPRLEIQRREVRTPGTGSSWPRVDTASSVVTPLRRGARSSFADGDAAMLPKVPPMPGGSDSPGMQSNGKGEQRMERAKEERAIARGAGEDHVPPQRLKS